MKTLLGLRTKETSDGVIVDQSPPIFDVHAALDEQVGSVYGDTLVRYCY